jgi:two-component system, NtrC family, response regulator HydG
VVHRALLLRKGPMIDASDLSFDEQFNAEVGVAVPEPLPGMTMQQMLEKLERQIVEATLRRYNNNRERVAKELGLARSSKRAYPEADRDCVSSFSVGFRSST